MTAKHTPGPWKADIRPQITYKPLPIIDFYGGCIAKISRFGTWGESVANARLIAGAPELLKALEASKQFLHEVHCRWPEDAAYGSTVLDQVDGAIAKATQ